MTIQELYDNPHLILLEARSGSHAYGTNLPSSDVDTRGVFFLPKAQFYGLGYTPQISDEVNDTIFYELGRFVELLSRNNPNILELLAMPEDCIQRRHPIMGRLRPADFLSKRCKDTFGGYAFTQVRKARGLNKKIVNPMPEERKTPLDFCYVLWKQGSLPLNSWLEKAGYRQEQCGLANIPHFRDTYGLYYDESGELGFSGVIRKPASNELSLSSIPKGLPRAAVLSFNKDGYQTYCKEYRQYWEWVEKRNEDRYENTLSHGKNYDAKNMMHTFRLLDMAGEIAREGAIRVRRPNREFLLDIRRGAFEYEQLVSWAEERMARIEDCYAQSLLPEEPDVDKINRILIEMREELYG
ncbi:MAG: nucleotidyltransferase domain-containing protein [Lewinellaceae bacterium]|nr:nucleotidyltransferase domain-containing protein [Phaeodactylibacter sp.]MCB9039893.1 nucleotidyltransferase domain-containing protein [Lewinellaceae bacterium]